MSDKPRRDWTKQLESSAKTAEELIVERGEILHTFILHCDGADHLVISPYRDDRERRLVLNAMSLMALAHNAMGLTIMAEAWMASFIGTQEESRTKYGPGGLENHPGRKEIVIVALAHFAGGRRKTLSCIREIARSSSGKVTGLREPERLDADAEMSGEMIDILPPAWPVPPSLRERAGEMLAKLRVLIKFETRIIHPAGHA